MVHEIQSVCLNSVVELVISMPIKSRVDKMESFKGPLW